MLIASATSTRVFLGVLCAVACAAFVGCGGSSEGSPSDAGSAGAGWEAGATGDAGADSSGVKWCDAYRVINCSCQQCHQAEPIHGAPIPLMTYEDTQAPFPTSTSTNRVWQTMEDVVGMGFMPFTGDSSVMPKVMPLSDADRTTLLDWLAQGAHDESGRACENSCSWSGAAP